MGPQRGGELDQTIQRRKTRSGRYQFRSNLGRVTRSHLHLQRYLDPTPSMVSSVTFIDYPYGEFIGLIDFMIWSVEIIV